MEFDCSSCDTRSSSACTSCADGGEEDDCGDANIGAQHNTATLKESGAIHDEIEVLVGILPLLQ